jgi:hypothetical protein
MLVGARVLARVPTGPPGETRHRRTLLVESTDRTLHFFDKVGPREAQEHMPA